MTLRATGAGYRKEKTTVKRYFTLTREPDVRFRGIIGLVTRWWKKLSPLSNTNGWTTSWCSHHAHHTRELRFTMHCCSYQPLPLDLSRYESLPAPQFCCINKKANSLPLLMGNTATPHWDVIVKDDDWLRSLPKVQLQQGSVNTIVESSLSKEELACESRGGFFTGRYKNEPNTCGKEKHGPIR